MGDSFNGGLFQGGWILFDYIESIHLEYFSRKLFQGSNVGGINLFFHGGRILCEHKVMNSIEQICDVFVINY